MKLLLILWVRNRYEDLTKFLLRENEVVYGGLMTWIVANILRVCWVVMTTWLGFRTISCSMWQSIKDASNLCWFFFLMKNRNMNSTIDSSDYVFHVRKP